MRRPRLTAVGRLTLWYWLLFTATASAIVGGTYALVSRGVSAGNPERADFIPPEIVEAFRAAGLDGPDSFLIAAAKRARDEVLGDLRRRSLAVLIIGVVLSTFGAWWLARRSLRPVRRITDMARGISVTNLHDRIELQGPDDELKGLADTFDSMLGRLETAFDTQRLFAAHVSHELRTPLAVLRAEAELAVPSTVPTTSALARMAVRQVDRADGLLESLLALARAESGTATRERVDLADIAGEVVGDLAGLADDAGLMVELELDPAIVHGDPALLRAAIENLVRNAIKYNHDGGIVDIRVGRSGDGRVLTVENTGRPIDADEAARLSRPFVRSDEDRAVSGNGIGMAVVAAVVAAHHGTWTITPRDGGGLTVTVSLPEA